MCEFTVQPDGGCIVGAGGGFPRLVQAKLVTNPVRHYSGAPFFELWIPVQAFELGGLELIANRVVMVLGFGGWTEIPSPVVKPVSVLVVKQASPCQEPVHSDVSAIHV